jgi:hypothetical protein
MMQVENRRVDALQVCPISGIPDIADGGLVPAILIASRNINVTEYIWKLRKVSRVGRRRH